MTRSGSAVSYTDKITALRWQDLPAQVQTQAKRCLKDILATAAGSLALPVSAQAQTLVEAQFGPGRVPLWFKGKGSSLAGAAFFNALTVDSLDCHDGFRPNKGHAGATVVPVAIAACANREVSGAELLSAVVIGYEVACRAGLALHAMHAPIFHASGTWAAVGAAAAGARIWGLSGEEFDEVLGMAEYYAPDAPMQRCTRHPSTVKDGAGAGAWAAAMALVMNDCRMSGLPSLFVAEPVGREQIASLGEDWMILRQYFKPYPTCRWTQPVVEATWHLQREHDFHWKDIEQVEVDTFDVGAELVMFPPQHSDGAQYSTPWAVAAALVDGRLGVEQIHPRRLTDPNILEVGHRVRTRVADDIQRRFPEECLARVTIVLKDGRHFTSPTMSARGDHNHPLPAQELEEKFDSLVSASLGQAKCRRLRETLHSLETGPAADLLTLLSSA